MMSAKTTSDNQCIVSKECQTVSTVQLVLTCDQAEF